MTVTVERLIVSSNSARPLRAALETWESEGGAVCQLVDIRPIDEQCSTVGAHRESR